MKANKLFFVALLSSFLAPSMAFAGVNQSTPANISFEALNKAWQGHPVSELATHPIFKKGPSEVLKIDDKLTERRYKQLFDVSGSVEGQLNVTVDCTRIFITEKPLLGKEDVIKSITEKGQCKDTTEYLPLKS